MGKKRKLKTVNCLTCGESRKVRVDSNPINCRNCALNSKRKKNTSNQVCSTVGCKNKLVSKSKIGMCLECWKGDPGKQRAKSYNRSMQGRLSLWRSRGAYLTEEDYREWDLQDRCELCGEDFGKKVMDHCHTTGKYRGALCFQCNTALGKLGDDLDLIISRLQKYGKQG